MGDRRLQRAAGDTRGDSRDLDFAAAIPVGIQGSGGVWLRRRIRLRPLRRGCEENSGRMTGTPRRESLGA